MKTPPCFLRIAVLGLVAAFCVTAHATTAVVGKKKVGVVAAVGTPAGGSGDLSLLDEAYGLLRVADHDYKGHRAHAMHAIEAAAHELGHSLGGGGKGHEKQATSDSQLHEAQGLLQQTVGTLAGKPHRHVEEAIKQLSIALSVK